MTAVTDRTSSPGGPHNAGPAELVARLKQPQPLLPQNAAQGEQDRQVVEESIQALRDAGVFKIAQPKRYGGYETSMRTMLDMSAAIGEAHGGTAWVATLLNVCSWTTGLFCQQAQDDVWGTNPDALISGVLTPTAETRKVEGGYRVSGKWFYNSGSWHADWATVGIPITDAGGNVVDQASALIPSGELEIEDTWFVAGMRSTGSNYLVAKDVFVPEHHVMAVPPAIEGHYATEHTDEALYRSAFVPSLALVLAGPQLGMGRAALEFVREKAASKAISYTSYTAQADSVAVQLRLAEAAMLIDSAHLHAYRAADDIDGAAARGDNPDYLTRARVRADTGWAIEHIVKAIDILLFAHGAASFGEGQSVAADLA